MRAKYRTMRGWNMFKMCSENFFVMTHICYSFFIRDAQHFNKCVPPDLPLSLHFDSFLLVSTFPNRHNPVIEHFLFRLFNFPLDNICVKIPFLNNCFQKVDEARARRNYILEMTELNMTMAIDEARE